MINTVRNEIIATLEETMTSYSFYKRISEKVTKFPGIIVDLRGDVLYESGTCGSKKAYNSAENFDVWCIHSEIQTSGIQSKSIDEAEANVVSGVSQIRDILLAKYGELVDFSAARYDEVYINGGHQFAGIITVKIGEIAEHGS